MVAQLQCAPCTDIGQVGKEWHAMGTFNQAPFLNDKSDFYVSRRRLTWNTNQAVERSRFIN